MLMLTYILYNTSTRPTWLPTLRDLLRGAQNLFIESINQEILLNSEYPCIARTVYYHRSFLISGCNAWNNLPAYLQKSVSLNSFKFNMFKYILAKTQF